VTSNLTRLNVYIACSVVLYFVAELCNIWVSWNILWYPDSRAYALHCSGTCYSPRETLQVQGL